MPSGAVELLQVLTVVLLALPVLVMPLAAFQVPLGSVPVRPQVPLVAQEAVQALLEVLGQELASVVPRRGLAAEGLPSSGSVRVVLSSALVAEEPSWVPAVAELCSVRVVVEQSSWEEEVVLATTALRLESPLVSPAHSHHLQGQLGV